jgi:hypothetical protein
MVLKISLYQTTLTHINIRINKARVGMSQNKSQGCIKQKVSFKCNFISHFLLNLLRKTDLGHETPGFYMSS